VLRTFDSLAARIISVVIATLMAVFVFAGAQTVASVPLFPAPLDKVAHFVYYGVMAMLFVHGIGGRWWWLALIATVLVGAGDEWHQSAVAGRDASVWDFLADVLGATLLIYLYHARRLSREQRS